MGDYDVGVVGAPYVDKNSRQSPNVCFEYLLTLKYGFNIIIIHNNNIIIIWHTVLKTTSNYIVLVGVFHTSMFFYLPV